MNDILKSIHAASAAQRARPKTEGRMIDAVDRKEATYSADAIKARRVVCELRTDNLPLIATAIASVTSDLGVKHKLQEVIERFIVATAGYNREELKGDKVYGWIGVGNGVLPAQPANAPEHQAEFAAAWMALLTLVNDCTKVGVHRPHREHPIMLLIDLPDPAALIVPSMSTDWN